MRIRQLCPRQYDPGTAPERVKCLNSKKNTYYKLFKTSFLTVILVLVFIGVIIISVSTVIYRNSKLDELRENGDLFIECLKGEYNITGGLSNDSVYRLHNEFCTGGGLEIRIYDEDGKCLLSPEHYTTEKNSDQITWAQNTDEIKPLQKSMIKKLEDDKYLSYDKSAVSDKEPHLIYGRRIFLRNGGSQIPTRMYALFYGRTDSISSFALKMAVFYIIFAAAAGYASYVLLRRRTKKYVNFADDLLRISEKYAKGDFSEKLTADIEGSAKDIVDYVNTLADEVKNREDTSRTFIANVSHELRTPMTTIIGFVDGILDGTIPKSRQNEYLVLVSKETHRLKILISSMLNMTRFESGTLTPNFQRTNMSDLVIQTVFMFEKKIDAKHLEIEGLDRGRLITTADPDLMQQVIYNLVENAVKFVNEGGTLSFRFDTTDEWHEIGIRNTGEGLKDDEIKKVFNRFYKTDSSRGKDTTGLGLGLSISRKIVHLHHGHIVVKSVYGEYTEFIIQLPVNDKVLMG